MKSKKLENTNSKFNNEVLNYLNDNLSQEDRYAFERQLHEDEFDFEAMEGLEDFDASDISKDKNQLNDLLTQKSSGKKRILYYRIAGIAAVGLILLLLVNQFFMHDLKNETSMLSDEVQVNKKEDASEVDIPPELPDEKAQKIMTEKIVKEVEKEENIIAEDNIGDRDSEEISMHDEAALAEVESNESVSNDELSLKEKEIDAQPIKVEAESIAKAEKRALAPTASRSQVKDLPSADFVATGYSTGDSDIVIRGKVVDMSTKEPLPGVNLVMEEAQLGTMTDMNGEFQINVPSKFADKSLKVNYIGFVPEQIPVNRDTSLVVGLTEDILALDEVVVVGYGTDKKKSNETGSVSIVEMPEGKAPIEEAAQPVMGFSEYIKYLKNNIIVPESLPEGKTERVKVKVTIHKDSQIRRVDVLSSPGEEFSKEAIRLLLEGPEWKAKTVNGEPETSEVTLRIKFRK